MCWVRPKTQRTFVKIEKLYVVKMSIGTCELVNSESVKCTDIIFHFPFSEESHTDMECFDDDGLCGTTLRKLSLALVLL